MGPPHRSARHQRKSQAGIPHLRSARQGLSLALALVVALCVASALAEPATARLPRGFVGITSEDVFAGNDTYRNATLRAQAAIGIDSIRQTFDWSTIERSPGTYDLSYHDRYVLMAARHGIGILPVLFNPPAFRRPSNGRAACPPRRNAAFARFAKLLVRRYGPNGTLWSKRPDVPRLPITAWQIWNEPNLRIYWCFRRPDAGRYVAMLRVVGRAIKRVDRRAEIVTAGLPNSKLRSAVPLARYLRGIYRAGARTAFDTIAINSYAKDHRVMRRLLTSVRRLMNARGDRRARIWLTELGWGDKGPKHHLVVGARGQARRIRRSFAAIKRLRRPLRLRGVVYFAWRDSARYPGLDRDLWGLHTGLLDLQGRPKPAFDAFRDAVANLR